MCRIHSPLLALSLCAAGAMALHPVAAWAQRHNGLSSPPTAPRRHTTSPANQTIIPVSSGMGALEFVTVNYGVPAPQSLTRQLEADDDRTRAASLSAIGAPAQYLVRGHIPYPHTTQLDLVALGPTDELDAILTVELDQHIVSAIMVPQGDNWHRVATVIDPTPFSDPRSTPATFLRIARSLIQHERYRAIYRAVTTAPNGDFTENEAQLRVLNNKAVVLISFASNERTCETAPRHLGCALTRRWLQPDPDDPGHRFILVTATGRLTPHEAAEPLADATTFQQAHLRSFSCQPYIYMDNSQHYEPTANSTPCPLK